MKLAKTNEKEIDSLMSYLLEIENISKYFDYDDESDFTHFHNEIVDEKEALPNMFRIVKGCNSFLEFHKQLFQQLSAIHFQRILWNCRTMLENCADPNSSHLDFNEDIKKGLELLEKFKSTTSVN